MTLEVDGKIANYHRERGATRAMLGLSHSDAPEQFPLTLRDATVLFAASRAAHGLFGNPLAKHYATKRLWESQEYERHVNDWQHRRYFI